MYNSYVLKRVLSQPGLAFPYPTPIFSLLPCRPPLATLLRCDWPTLSAFSHTLDLKCFSFPRAGIQYKRLLNVRFGF